MASFTQFLKLYKPVTDEIGWDDNMNSNLDIVDGFVNQFMNIPGFVGAWVNAHAYAIGNVTVDPISGQFFKCAVAHTSAATGTFAADRTARPTLWVATTTPSQDSAAAAAASAAAAANSAASATTQLTNFQNTYYGAAATPPLTDPHGNARTAGDLYFDTTTLLLNVWSGTAWLQVNAAFADAPTTAPTTNVYVRGGDHTWKLGVGSAGGDFTGDVYVGPRMTVGGVHPSANVPGGHLRVDQFMVRGAVGYNLYLSVTPPYTTAAPGWRYFETTGFAGAFMSQSLTVQAGASAGVRVLQFYSTKTGEAIVTDGTTNVILAAQMDSNGNFVIPGGGFQPNGGPWFNSLSDARGKTVIGPYPRGLTELLEMLPKLFTFKGNVNAVAPDGSMGDPIVSNTTKQYIGLIAQDCEPYMPEMVMQTSAYIDGVLVTDLRQLDTNALTFALINAVATLDARLKALEG